MAKEIVEMPDEIEDTAKLLSKLIVAAVPTKVLLFSNSIPLPTATMPVNALPSSAGKEPTSSFARIVVNPIPDPTNIEAVMIPVVFILTVLVIPVAPDTIALLSE